MAMFRLFTSRSLLELWRQQPLKCLPVCQHRASVYMRHLGTGSPLWKDALPSVGDKCEANDTVDLDMWKSVMRKAAAEGTQQQTTNEGEDAAEDESEGGTSSLEAIRNLVMMWRYAGKKVPENLTDEQLETVSKLTTQSARKKYMKYLAIKEQYKKKDETKKQQKVVEKEAMLEKMRAENGGTEEQPGNSLVLKHWTKSEDRCAGWNSAQAMRFNQPLVFDMSYESILNWKEIQYTVSQLLEMEGWNRRAKEPFHVHFCNLKPGGAFEQALRKRYGAEAWERLLITSTERQHLDIFSPKSLVYLTSDSPNVLHTFDRSKVYIIGAMVDRMSRPGVSFANAKRLKLKTARLPLDEYLHWQTGGKDLTLDQMIRIMLTAKETNSRWDEALKFVPVRKHQGFYKENYAAATQKRTSLKSGMERRKMDKRN